MRTLIIQHDDNTGPGVMRDAIAAAGEIVMWHPVQDNERHELEGIDAVFIMGGNANPTEDFHPWLAGELDLIEEALDVGTPILGICLGGQLLARAAGGVVGKAVKPEVAAWRDVGIQREAADDLLLAAMPLPFFGFQWHSYGFEAPPGAVLLAANDSGQQAFRLQNRAWGLQFHLEIDAEIVAEWANEAPEIVDANGGFERLSKATETFVTISVAAAREVAERFAIAAQVTCGELSPDALAALERRPDPIAEAQALGVPPEVIAAMLRMRDQQRF